MLVSSWRRKFLDVLRFTRNHLQAILNLRSSTICLQLPTPLQATRSSAFRLQLRFWLIVYFSFVPSIMLLGAFERTFLFRLRSPLKKGATAPKDASGAHHFFPITNPRKIVHHALFTTSEHLGCPSSGTRPLHSMSGTECEHIVR